MAEDIKNPIGKTSAPERFPNTSFEFSFWLNNEVRLNPLDFVVVEHIDKSRTVGVVKELFTQSDSDGYLTDYIGNNFGDPSSQPYVERVRTTIAKVEVLRNIRKDDFEEMYMPVPSGQSVYLPDVDAIKAALGFDNIQGLPIPAGIIKQSSGSMFPVYVDSDYLLGPESAHMNITGISGIAGKTSYAMFLLYSVWQTLKREGKRMSAVIFNVKHADLLHIDEPPTDLTERDKKIYEALNLPIEQFDNVEYILPRAPNGIPDSDSPPSKYTLYAFTLKDVHSDLDLLLSDLSDPFLVIDAFTTYVRDNWNEDGVTFYDYSKPEKDKKRANAKTWDDLLNVPETAIGYTVYNNRPDHPTPKRLKTLLRTLKSQNPGLFVNSLDTNETLLGNKVIENIKSGKITVIDIYRISSRIQPFIVGHVMRAIENYYRNIDTREISPLIIFIDELNTFAPDKESPDAITWQIIEIARKGRGRMTSLFGVQQFKSQVHSQVWGNSTLNAIGNVGSEELSTTPYRNLDDNIKKLIPSLRQGELVLSFKKWRTPIKVTFPKPPYKRPRRT